MPSSAHTHGSASTHECSCSTIQKTMDSIASFLRLWGINNLLLYLLQLVLTGTHSRNLHYFLLEEMQGDSKSIFVGYSVETLYSKRGGGSPYV